MTVNEIREKLVEEYGLTWEEANNIKGKSTLMKRLQAEEQADRTMEELVDDIDVDRDFVTSTSNVDARPSQDEDVITKTDVRWQSYVMSIFTKDELVEDRPTLQGLRRVSQLIMGPIIRCEVKEVYVYGDNMCAIVEIEFPNKLEYDSCVFSDVSDVNERNTQEPYSKYPASVASSRAEARALRRALNLSIVSDEEITGRPEGEVAYISTAQKRMISSRCKDLNVDEEKFFSHYDGKDGSELVQLINQFQQDMSTIPEEVKNEG